MMQTDSTFLSSVTLPLDIAGASTAWGRKDPAREPPLVPHQSTAAERSVQKPTASIIETVSKPPVQRGTPFLEHMPRSVMQMERTFLNSVTDQLGIAGAWTALDRRDQAPGRTPVHHNTTAANQMNQCAPKPDASTTETASKPPAQRDILLLDCMYLNVTRMASTQPNSAMAQLDTAGAWTVWDRKDRAPGRDQGRPPWTVPNRMNRSGSGLTVSTIETVSRPPTQRGTPHWEPMSRSVMLMDSTFLCSAMGLLDIVGAWTVQDKRDQGQGHLQVLHQWTVTDQLSRLAPKLTVSTIETVSRPALLKASPWPEPTSHSAMKTDSTPLNSATALRDTAGVWTAQDKRDQALGAPPAHPEWTVTGQSNQPAPELTVSITETLSKPAVLMVLLWWAPMSRSVMKTDSTHLNSAMAPRDTVGVWTVRDRRDQAQGAHLGPQEWTVTAQLNRLAPKHTVSTTETASRALHLRDVQL